MMFLFQLCFDVIGKTGQSTAIGISDVLTDIEVGISVDVAAPSCPISNLTADLFEVDINCENLYFCWNACSASDVDGQGGSIIITPCGGDPKYTILVGNSSFSGVCEGESVMVDNLNGSNTSYTVRIIDASGNVYDDLVVLGNAPELIAYVSGTNPSCSTSSNGCARIDSIVGGIPFTDGSYDIEWSTGIYNIDSICGIPIDSIVCVTVTDSVGCKVTECITLSIDPLDFTVDVIEIPTCLMPGMQGDGVIKIIPSGGTGPYRLDNSSIPMDSFMISNLNPGKHTFIVRDSNNCLLEVCVDLEAQLAFDFTVVEFSNSCGEEGGMIRILVEIPGQTNVNVAAQVFCLGSGNLPCGVLGGDLIICENIPPGSCTVIATDFVSDCSSETSFIIDEYDPLIIELEIEQPGCGGDDGKITVTNVDNAIDDITYTWSLFGETSDRACNLPGGTYSVTVSDGRCQADTTVTLNPGGTTSVEATCTPVDCLLGLGGTLSATVTGGSGGNVTYNWYSLPLNQIELEFMGMQNVTNVLAGTYYVVATDESTGCEVSDTCIIDNPAEIFIEEAGQTSPSCFNNADGVICVDVLVGTNTPLTFSWVGPNGYMSQDSAKITDAPCGTYTVTVQDITGCAASIPIELICPPAVSVEITIIEPVICDSLNSGKALAIASGGTSAGGGYSFEWSSGSQNQGPIGTGIGFIEGTQWVIACDDNNCCSDPLEFEIPGIIPIEITESIITNVSCFELADGSITVVPTGGDEPYTYEWFDASTGDTHEDLAPGWHLLTVTDFDGCIKEDSLLIEEPEMLLAEIDFGNTNDIACASENSGRITVDVVGGTPPYIYEWTGAISTTDEAAGLAVGEYCITVTDANNCMDDVCHTIGTALPVTAVMDIPELPLCAGGSSCISVQSVTGGIGNNYTFSVNFGTPIAIDSCLEVNAGTYAINVFDSTGCAFMTSVEVFEPNPVLVDLGEDITIQLGDTLTQITASITSDLPIDTIVWSELVECNDDAFCNEVIISPANSTTYGVTVTDTNGCIGIDDIIVTIDDVRNVFTSNIFSPNGDGTNDVFRIITGKGVEEVLEFQIYNRWGSLIFSAEGSPDDLGSVAWDGRYNGKEVQPGVFVYIAKVRFIDDKIIDYKGSVTVVK